MKPIRYVNGTIHAENDGYTLCGRKVEGVKWFRLRAGVELTSVTCRSCNSLMWGKITKLMFRKRKP